MRNICELILFVRAKSIACEMEGLKLSEQEQQLYGELFQTCDVDGSGKITGIKAAELFRASGLSQDQLLQVTFIAIIYKS